MVSGAPGYCRGAAMNPGPWPDPWFVAAWFLSGLCCGAFVMLYLMAGGLI